MTLTGQPAMSLLDSVLNAENTRVDIDVAMLQKAQNIQKQEGVGMVDLLAASGLPPNRSLLDVFA